VTYEFDAEVLLYRPNELGAGDIPRGEGYSPYFLFCETQRSVGVRFVDFAGRWDESSRVKVELYHELGPSDVTVHPGDTIQVVMGDRIIGEGTVLSFLREKPVP
jgi:hypothetical protein